MDEKLWDAVTSALEVADAQLPSPNSLAADVAHATHPTDLAGHIRRAISAITSGGVSAWRLRTVDLLASVLMDATMASDSERVETVVTHSNTLGAAVSRRLQELESSDHGAVVGNEEQLGLEQRLLEQLGGAISALAWAGRVASEQIYPPQSIASDSNMGRMLNVIAAHRNANNNDIARELDCDKSEVSRCGRKLWNAGLATATKVGRFNAWSLTAKGCATYKRMNKVASASGTVNLPVDRAAFLVFHLVESIFHPSSAIDQADAMERLWTLRDKVRNALKFFVTANDVYHALRLGAMYGRVWWTRAYVEGWDQLTTVLELECPSALRSERATALTWHAKIGLRIHHLDQAQRDATEVLLYAEEIGDKRLEADALNNAALVDAERNEIESARSRLVRAMDLIEQAPEAHIKADTLDNLGWIAFAELDLPRAHRLFAKSLETYRSVRDIGGVEDLQLIAWVHVDLAEVSWRLHADPVEAAKHADIALELGKRFGDAGIISHAYITQAKVAQERGDFPSSERLLNDSLNIIESLGNVRVRVQIYDALARLASLQRNPKAASQWDDRAVEVAADVQLARTKSETSGLDKPIVDVGQNASLTDQDCGFGEELG